MEPLPLCRISKFSENVFVSRKIQRPRVRQPTKKRLSDHLLLSYGEHLSKNTGDKRRLYEVLRDHLQLDASESERLQAALLSEHFSHEQARFNQGIAGRGREVPETVRQHLIEHARFFEDELTAPHRRLLFGVADG